MKQILNLQRQQNNQTRHYLYQLDSISTTFWKKSFALNDLLSVLKYTDP